METLAFTEPGSPHNDSRKPRNRWIILSVVASLVILVLISLLVACFLFLYKQLPKKCWIHGHSPETGPLVSQAAIVWKWKPECSGSGIRSNGSSLEIMESDMYFVYIYVARREDVTTNQLFTVQLVQLNSNSNKYMKLYGINDTRASITLGRPFYLEKGTTLSLVINGVLDPTGLDHIDSNRTYWGLFRM